MGNFYQIQEMKRSKMYDGKASFQFLLKINATGWKMKDYKQQLYALKYVLRILMRESYSNILVVSSVDVETSVIC